MDGVNKTLYIPLYGKAFVSRKGIILNDPAAEAIWEKEQFPLKGKSRSKWLAYNMGMRSRVFDDWLTDKMEDNPGAVVLHIGCGMDSRIKRLGTQGHRWYDIDFPEVIAERRRYYSEDDLYRMVAADMRDEEWKERIPQGEAALVVMEGVSMYFRPEELVELLQRLGQHFSSVCILMDCYSVFAAKASKYKNPINDVGVTTVYGMDDAKKLAEDTGLSYVGEHSLTPLQLIGQLSAGERIVFCNLFAGRFARKIYRLYEFQRK